MNVKSLLAIAILGGIFLPGCSGNSANLDKMSRADQEKTLAGDPVQGQKIGEQMRQKYMGGGSVAAQPNSSGAVR